MKTKALLLSAGLAMFLVPAFAQNEDIPLRAYELRMNGNPGLAMNILDSALALYPDSARMWFEKGRTIDWVKLEGCDRRIEIMTVLAPNLRKCRKSFETACRLDPGNARYHYWAANNQSLLAMTAIYSPWKWPFIRCIFKKCVDHADAAVRLDPENPEYRSTLVSFSRLGWFFGGNAKTAKAHADTLYRMDPVYGVRAYKELETKKHPYDAVAGYAEAARKNPDHLWLLQHQATLYSRKETGRLEQAIACLTRMLELDPLNTWAITQLYRVMPDHRKAEAAGYVENYLKAADSVYNFYKAVGQQLMGQYYQSQKDSVRAEACFNLARQYNPVQTRTSVTDLRPPGK